eukprot:5806900-Amphidinium_carterae.1
MNSQGTPILNLVLNPGPPVTPNFTRIAISNSTGTFFWGTFGGVEETLKAIMLGGRFRSGSQRVTQWVRHRDGLEGVHGAFYSSTRSVALQRGPQVAWPAARSRTQCTDSKTTVRQCLCAR